MFEWKNDYSVGLANIDAQHRNLFAIGQELYTAMSSGKGKQSCGRILDRLVSYTAIHFEAEERLMRSAKFPDLKAHEAQHRALVARVQQFQSDFKSGRVTLTVQLLHFLQDWLETHIKGSDKQYAPYLKPADSAVPVAQYRT